MRDFRLLWFLAKLTRDDEGTGMCSNGAPLEGRDLMSCIMGGGGTRH